MVSIRLLGFDSFDLFLERFPLLSTFKYHEDSIDTLSILLGATLKSFEVVLLLKELNASTNLS